MYDLYAPTIPPPDRCTRAWRWVLVLLAAVTLGVLASELLTPRPLETHEVFVAQTAREMLARGDWILPTYNAEPRLNKPPLAYWLVMALERVAPSEPPVPEWKARFPSALAAAALVVLTAEIARAVYPLRAGVAILAALIVLGSSGVLRYGANARPEMLYAASCALMVLALVRAWKALDRSRSQAGWAAVMWIAFALAILAKGPHFPLLILLGVTVHARIEGRLSRLRWILNPFPAAGAATGVGLGAALMLLLAAPWFIAVWIKAPSAGAVWTGQLTDAHDQDNWTWREMLAPYYLWGIPQIMLPWIALTPFGFASCFVRGPEALRRGRLLFWIFVAVLVVLSFSTHRRSYYMLPMLPVLAPLAAAGALDALGKLRGILAALAHLTLWIGAVAVVVLFAVLGTLDFVWGAGGDRKDEFARRVASLAGASTVYLIDEPPGLITYRLGRVTPVLGSPEELPRLIDRADNQEILVIMPPSTRRRLPRGLDAETMAWQDTGEKSEALVLLRVRPAMITAPPR